MTEQELFDATLLHLRKQQARSTTPAGVCLYKGWRGACAMGCHLLPGEYSPDMERYSVDQLIEQGKWPARLTEHRSLMKELQTAHDIDLAVSLGRWELQMKTIAKYFGLIYTDKE
jgi:hypothetical protein